MNKKNILGASEAMNNLEENSLKLSGVVTELTDLKENLGDLNDEVKKAQETNKEGNKNLLAFAKTVEEVQDKLAQEIRLRITENAAEQNSRLKDANEKIASVNIKLESLKVEVLKTTQGTTEVLNSIEENNQKFNSFQNRFYLFLLLALLLAAYFGAEKFGLI